jgi:hypothetical protein
MMTLNGEAISQDPNGATGEGQDDAADENNVDSQSSTRGYGYFDNDNAVRAGNIRKRDKIALIVYKYSL